MKNFKFLYRALASVFTSKECAVSNIPSSLPNEIYLCAPIWGGRLAAPAQYFLKHSDLSGKKANILVTAETPIEKYKTRALEYLSQLNCVAGDAYIFATSKGLPEKDIIIEHMHELMRTS
ncbi:MAG: hypothetical protein FWC92_04185 [Defluviitaleaceae bacterium]|nr:hypothetical protein [Defluviitaleaceae bacterium]